MPPLEQVLKGRRILLTGATGFLGKVFLSILLRWHPEIERVYLLIRGDRRSSVGRFRREILDSPVFAPLREHLGDKFDRYIEEKVVVVPGDITNDGLLGEEAKPFKPGSLDAVVHCAGLVNFEASLEKAIEVNTTGVANVIEFCRQSRRRDDARLDLLRRRHRRRPSLRRRHPRKLVSERTQSFRLEREIRDALAAIERVQAESRDQLRHAEFRGDDDDDGNPRESALEHRRKQWVEERLKDVGRERAQSWGWPNTYSYTKSLGEQLVLAHRDKLDVTVVRPAVIESALRDPFPGWNQGVNTSAPLTYLAGRGYRFYPAKAELVLDVIPVDLAAHAMIPILGALLSRKHKPIYQLCTSDRNPLPMRRLVELTALSNRREHRKDGGTMRWLGPHLEAVVVSQNTYDLASEKLPQILKQAAAFARSVVGEENQRAKKIESEHRQVQGEHGPRARTGRSLSPVYSGAGLHFSREQHSRALRDAQAGRRRASSVSSRPDRLARLLDQHSSAGTAPPHFSAARSSHARTAQDAPASSQPGRDARARGGPLRRAVAMIARRPSGEQTQTTYRELRDRAHRAALLLATRGIKPGDRVLLIGENSPDWVLGYFAILCAGAIAVPLDQLISAEELAPICKIAEPAAVLSSSAVHKRLGSALGDAHPKLIELDLAELSRPFILRGAAKTPLAPPERKALASIVFTSGSTGAPKGVMLSHGNFAAEVAMLSRVFSLGADDVVLSLLPLHHAFEFTCGMLLPLASGATIVYPLEVDAKTLSRTLADVRPTALIGVPAVWEAVHRRIVDEVEGRGPFFHAAFDNLRDLNRRLDANSGLNFGSIVFRQVHSALGGRLRLAVSGGSALPHRVAEFFNDIGIPLLEGYGLTEAAPVLSVARPDEPLRVGAVGRPLNGVEIKLMPATGSIGEIVAHGPNVMQGYYRNEAATDEVLRDGWLHTGDLGRLDDDGRLYIVGRAKEVIVDSGGNNIYIEELEEIYGRSEYVKEMAVVGLKVGQGEQVAALVVPAYARGESRRAVEDRLRTDFDKVARELSAHKRIRILRFTDAEMPRTRTRKIKRADVAAMLRRMLEVRTSVADAANSEVETWLAEALASVATEPVNISPATRLIEDLGLDSLALAEVGELIGERAGREIAPEEIADLRTVADLQILAAQPGGNGRQRVPSYAKFAEPYTVHLPSPLKWIGRLRGARRRACDFRRMVEAEDSRTRQRPSQS